MGKTLLVETRRVLRFLRFLWDLTDEPVYSQGNSGSRTRWRHEVGSKLDRVSSSNSL